MKGTLHILIFCFLILDIFPQEDSLAGHYYKKHKPTSAADKSVVYDLHLYIGVNNKKDCIYNEHIPGVYHKRGTWELKSDTLICTYNVELIRDRVNKPYGTKEKQLSPPVIHKYLARKKNVLTPLTYGETLIKAPPKPQSPLPPSSEPIDGVYILDHYKDSLAQVKVRIEQTNDSISKLFIGKWRSQHVPHYQDRYPGSPASHLKVVDENLHDKSQRGVQISDRQRKKLNKRHRREYGYETYVFNSDGTYSYQCVAAKRSKSILYSNITAKGFWKVHYESESPIGKCIVLTVDDCEGCNDENQNVGFYIYNIKENTFFTIGKSRFSPDAILRNSYFSKADK